MAGHGLQIMTLGQSFHPAQDDRSPRLLEMHHRRKVTSLSAGNGHTWELLDNGECYAWGEVLGSGITSPQRVTQLGDDKRIVGINCGFTTALTLLATGEVHYWTSNSATPVQVFKDQQNIVDIACSNTHLLALNAQGVAFMITQSRDMSSASVTTCSVGDGQVIRSIAVNLSFSVAITDQGKVYTWGIGPLGYKDGLAGLNKPQPVLLLGEKKIVSAACGEFHVAVITDSGEVYTWGSNMCKQLGHSAHATFVTEPGHVSSLIGKKAVQVACGAYHTAVVTSKGALYTFGSSPHGQLGHGDLDLSMLARQVDCFENYFVHKIACGSHHMVAVVENGLSEKMWMDDMGAFFVDNVLLTGAGDPSKTFGDVYVQLIGSQMPPLLCHRIILRAMCPPFTRALDLLEAKEEEAGKLLTIKVEGLSDAEMVELMRFVYCARIDTNKFTPQNYINIFKWATVNSFEALLNALYKDFDSFLPSEVCAQWKALHAIVKEQKSEDGLDRAIAEDMRYQCGYRLHQMKSTVNDSADFADIKADFSATYRYHHYDKAQDMWEEVDPDTHTFTLPLHKKPATKKRGSDAQEGFLFHALKEWVNFKRYSDISFTVEDQTVYAHKIILCARSSLFRAMLTSGMREAQSGVIEGLDMSADSLNCFLQYMYAAEPNINGDNVVEVLVAANQYDMQHLQERCEAFLERGMSSENAAFMLEMAHRYESPHLRALAMKHMLEQRAEVTSTDAYQQLSAELVAEFKQSDVHAANCKVLSTGTGKVVAGETFSFRIEAYDCNMRRCATGNVPFECKVVEKVIIPVSEQNRRRLVLRRNQQTASRPSVSPAMHSHAKRSRDDETTSPPLSRNSKSTDEDLDSPTPNSPEVSALITPTSPTPSSTTLTSSTEPKVLHEIPARISQGSLLGHPDGTYLVRVSPDRKGEYVVTVSLDGVPISGCPFEITVEEPFCTAKCFASGKGMCNAQVHTETTFTIVGVDNLDRRMRRGGALFLVLFTHGGSIPSVWQQAENPALTATGKVEDNRDGTFTVTYTLPQSGLWTMEITRAGNPIKGSPFTILCTASKVSPSNCTYFLVSSFMHCEAMFYVLLKDAYGNDQPPGNEIRAVVQRIEDENSPLPDPTKDVNLLANNPDLSAEELQELEDTRKAGVSNVNAVTNDMGNGSFSVQLQVPEPGKYSIYIYVWAEISSSWCGWRPIFGCPFIQDIRQTTERDTFDFSTIPKLEEAPEQPTTPCESLLDKFYEMHVTKKPSKRSPTTNKRTPSPRVPSATATPSSPELVQSMPGFTFSGNESFPTPTRSTSIFGGIDAPTTTTLSSNPFGSFSPLSAPTSNIFTTPSLSSPTYPASDFSLPTMATSTPSLVTAYPLSFTMPTTPSTASTTPAPKAPTTKPATPSFGIFGGEATTPSLFASIPPSASPAPFAAPATPSPASTGAGFSGFSFGALPPTSVFAAITVPPATTTSTTTTTTGGFFSQPSTTTTTRSSSVSSTAFQFTTPDN